MVVLLNGNIYSLLQKNKFINIFKKKNISLEFMIKSRLSYTSLINIPPKNKKNLSTMNNIDYVGPTGAIFTLSINLSIISPVLV